MPKEETKKEKRDAARQARLEAQRARERAKKRKKMMTTSLIIVIAAAIVGYIIFKVSESDTGVGQLAKAAGCVTKDYKELPAAPHLGETDPTPEYNSNPPSSGLHLGRTAPWGTSAERIEDKMLVHNLEHGGIIVHYKDLSDTDIDSLEELVDSYADGVIANPNPDVPTNIAMSAWGDVQTCEKFSEPVVKAFIKEHCNKGPEKLGLRCAG